MQVGRLQCAVVLLALVAGWGTRALGQAHGLAGDTPELRTRCATYAIESDSPYIPAGFFILLMQQRPEIQKAKLQLVTNPDQADAVVRLTNTGDHGTWVDVSNRATAEHYRFASNWTMYPGMVAADTVSALRTVCPGTIPGSEPSHRAAFDCPKPPEILATVTRIGVCSHTSWMDSDDIVHALQARLELKQLPVEVVPGCSQIPMSVEVTHDLDHTIEWAWALQESKNTPLMTGRVIAFDKHDAAAKITSVLAKEFTLAHRDQLHPAHPAANAPPSVSSGQTIGVLLIPSDFSMFDTRLSLYIDSERAEATDVTGRVIFDFRLEQVLAARLTTDWRRDYQLPDPTPIAMKAGTSFGQVFGDIGMDPNIDPMTQKRSPVCNAEKLIWNINGLPVSCPVLDAAVSTVRTAGLVGYTTAGAVLALIPVRTEVLDVAWEVDGAVKEVSLQVPILHSKRLLHTFESVEAIEQQPQGCNYVGIATTTR
jgi:hypothetical protein